MVEVADIANLLKENDRLKRELKDHVRTKTELLVYKHQMDAIFDNAPVELYLKDRKGRYVKINKEFEKIFGVNNDDVVG